jgi:hypothetical protein
MGRTGGDMMVHNFGEEPHWLENLVGEFGMDLRYRLDED